MNSERHKKPKGLLERPNDNDTKYIVSFWIVGLVTAGLGMCCCVENAEQTQQSDEVKKHNQRAERIIVFLKQQI